MKKTALTLTALSTLLISACGGSQETTAVEAAPKLDTLDAKVNYLIGYGNVKQLQTQGVEVSIEAFSAGAKAAASGAESLIPEDQAQAIFTEYQTLMQAKAEAEINAKKEINAAASTAFLAENATKEGVQVTESGLQYKVIEQGDGPQPTEESTVQVHYEGKLIDGTVFDSSIARGTPIEFALTQVIPGWTEGVQLMAEGSTFEFYIPSELAYGENGPASIGPNQALIFQVELIQANYSAE